MGIGEERWELLTKINGLGLDVDRDGFSSCWVWDDTIHEAKKELELKKELLILERQKSIIQKKQPRRRTYTEKGELSLQTQKVESLRKEVEENKKQNLYTCQRSYNAGEYAWIPNKDYNGFKKRDLSLSYDDFKNWFEK